MAERKNKKKDKYFVSTAIDYVNASPHIGHTLEKVQADVIARYYRALGGDVFFVTGTDENSLKSVQAAEKEGLSIKSFVNKNAKEFHKLKTALNLSISDFIRTTEERHIKGAEKLWRACQKDIYKKKYQGLYCVGCEEFYKEDELIDGFCPEHKEKPELVEEENYFFELTKYQNQLKDIYEKDIIEIIPKTRRNEVLSFINSGLYDFCISRSAERGRGWGIPVPKDPSQIMWTWFDALSNYINVLGYAENSESFQERWQNNRNKLHIIGKGILRFHAIYWPAMLLSAGLSLPKKIFVHGYLTINGQKISKSLGNIIDPFELVKKYGADTVRYFLLREFSSTEDGDFSIKRLEERYNADLANGLGNLVSRVLTLSEKTKINYKARVNENKLENEVQAAIKICPAGYSKAMEGLNFNEALQGIWTLMNVCDEHIEKNKPWKLLEDNKEKFNETIAYLLMAIKKIADLLQPFMPETSDKILNQLNQNKKTEVLFPRL